MTDRLTPLPDSPTRTLDEMIGCLREEFRFVDADLHRGSDHIGDMITQFLRMIDGFRKWPRPPEYADEIRSAIDRLSGKRESAAYIVLGDDANEEDSLIEFNLVPGEDIVIGYTGQNHEEIGSLYARRVAEALGYELESE